jgi:prepilin-type N-terminal cleavage/methylation domain-containing protein
MKNKTYYYRLARGFSLLEMAVVLIILGFVLGALLMPLQAQRNQLFQSQTENTLEIAKKSLLGFAQAKGRLPCPATAVSNGLEAPLGGSTCISQLGYLPAATLGIQPTDANGFAVDAWNNRIMYAVAQNSAVTVPANPATPDFTTNTLTDGMGIVGIANLTPELRVCNSATGITATACSGGAESNYLINNAVVVIYSLGATGAQAAGGVDENANPNVPANPKSVFVSHEVTAAGVANGEFDHIVTWISPYVLYNAMIEAGQLH